MRSVFERALGAAYDDLHPEIRRRFALASDDDERCVGRGRMRSIRRNPVALPVLWVGTRWNLLFPETGTNVPFEVRTTPFRDSGGVEFQDSGGVETVAYVREFDVGPTRRFDAYMTYDEARGCVVDALGSNRALHTELAFSATDDGALAIATGDQWLVWRDRTVPIPSALRADVAVTERYEDDADRFEVAVDVSNPLVGDVFAYDGWFTVEYEPRETLPAGDAPADYSESH